MAKKTTKNKLLSEREKKIGEASDILDAIGQENEKEGIKWTKYFMDKFNREQWNKDQLTKEQLKKNRIDKEKYKNMLFKLIQENLLKMDIPSYFRVDVKKTTKGIVTGYLRPFSKKWKYKAFTPSGNPEKDFTYVVNLLSALDSAIIIDNNNRLTDSGIVLPKNTNLNVKKENKH